MNSISAIIRIIAGAAILLLSYSTYTKTFANYKDGQRLLLFGNETGASASQLHLAFGVFAVIGAGLLLMGLLTLFKSKR